jgi:hypothetical protein
VEHDLKLVEGGEDRVRALRIVHHVEAAPEALPALQHDSVAQQAQEVLKLGATVLVVEHLDGGPVVGAGVRHCERKRRRTLQDNCC